MPAFLKVKMVKPGSQLLKTIDLNNSGRGFATAVEAAVMLEEMDVNKEVFEAEVTEVINGIEHRMVGARNNAHSYSRMLWFPEIRKAKLQNAA